MLEPQGTEEYKRGLRKVTETIFNCPTCKQPTNTFFQPTIEILEPIFSCSIKCADIISKRFLK